METSGRLTITVIKLLLLLSVATVVCSEKDFSARMPVHRTKGILDLITPRMVLKALGRFFKTPLKLIKHFINPFLHHARTVWSWVGPGTTVAGMTPMGARMIQDTLDSIKPETVEAFFEALGV